MPCLPTAKLAGGDRRDIGWIPQFSGGGRLGSFTHGALGTDVGPWNARRARRRGGAAE
jgi:hypothetical protein